MATQCLPLKPMITGVAQGIPTNTVRSVAETHTGYFIYKLGLYISLPCQSTYYHWEMLGKWFMSFWTPGRVETKSTQHDYFKWLSLEHFSDLIQFISIKKLITSSWTFHKMSTFECNRILNVCSLTLGLSETENIF